MHAPICIRSMHACMHVPILGLLSYIGLAFVYAFDCIYNNNLCFMLQRILFTARTSPLLFVAVVGAKHNGECHEDPLPSHLDAGGHMHAEIDKHIHQPPPKHLPILGG